MLSTSVNRPSRKSEMLLCDSTKLLINSREFYVLLESFCNSIIKDNQHYDDFLNRYFNDEGYIDIWRIPHLMIDAFNHNLKFHKVLESDEFRHIFHQFLAELYNFFLCECQPRLLVEPEQANPQDIVYDLRVRQQFLNTLMYTFINVMENIENDDNAEVRM
jgi:hypothetical protein